MKLVSHQYCGYCGVLFVDRYPSMNYQFERFWLDVNTRTLLSDKGEQPIRPKTLALLLYLIEHKNEIVSKEQLLKDIWDDVGVNEGVIFQSVREIRKMFADPAVIHNHPRKGYQWVGRVTALDKQQDQKCESGQVQVPVSDRTDRRLPLLKACLSACALTALLVWFMLPSSSSNPQLLLLPLHNQVDSSDHQNLATDGTRQLYHLLVENNSHLSVSVSRQPSILSDSNDVFATESPWQLSASIYGDVYDYKLIYRLINHRREYEGVIFARSVERAFQLLIEIVVTNIQQLRPDLAHLQPEAYQNSALAQAMVAYETDWEAATSHLQRYLQQNTESVQGGLYLSRLYIWQGENERALELIKTALERQTKSLHLRAELLYNQALAYSHQQPRRALESIEKAIGLAEQPDTWLTRAKLEELRADIHYQQNQFVPALRGYLKAQSFFEQIQASTSLAGLQLKLAALYIGSGEMEMARRTFMQAKTMIQQKEMSFLYAALMEFELQHQLLLYQL
jgi:DNA-binding winged helix-turn-helix (wHTH) protein/tetratricopeptide (TPR) repeat protein